MEIIDISLHPRIVPDSLSGRFWSVVSSSTRLQACYLLLGNLRNPLSFLLSETGSKNLKKRNLTGFPDKSESLSIQNLGNWKAAFWVQKSVSKRRKLYESKNRDSNEKHNGHRNKPSRFDRRLFKISHLGNFGLASVRFPLKHRTISEPIRYQENLS